MLYVLGIDPGNVGAFAWLTDAGDILDIVDMPLIAGDVDTVALLELLDAGTFYGARATQAVLEWPGLMPKNGAKSARSMGMALGRIETALIASSIPVQRVSPAAWKKAMGLSSNKGASRALAQRTWPAEAERFKRVKDDGRAEAALLGRWWMTKGDGGALTRTRASAHAKGGDA